MQLRVRRVLAAAIPVTLGLALVLVAPASPAAAASCHAGTASDFNGDGIADAAIAEPIAERFHVLYGTRSGLTADASGTALDDQLIAAPTGASDGFGNAMVAADFNGDGCTDLAVADPFANVGDVAGAGVVFIYLGSPAGLLPVSSKLDELTLGGTAEEDSSFGWSLAAGNFNGDAIADLVIGAPFVDGGGVFVVPGSVSQSFTGARQFVQGDGTVPGASEDDDNFGTSVATADFNGDHISDLVVGDPGENDSHGAVVVLRGSGTGTLLTATGRQSWSQNSPGVPGTAEDDDIFGRAVATGDFNGDGHPDLAVGAPGEDIGTVNDAGTVDVIYGSSSGLTGTGAQGWTQNSPGVAGTAEHADEFGRSLATGDFNGDGRSDLAIGAPEESLGSDSFAGTVNVLVGTSAGLSATGSSSWNEGTPGITGSPTGFEQFGNTLTVLRIRSSARDDLLVGTPNEVTSLGIGTGMVEFIPGSGTGLTATNSKRWDDSVAGVKGTACVPCSFGQSVS